jgi:hypothetical protein
MGPTSVFPNFFSIALVSLWNRMTSWLLRSVSRRRRPELIAETTESRRDLLQGLNRIPEGIDCCGRGEEEQPLAVAEVFAFTSTDNGSPDPTRESCDPAGPLPEDAVIPMDSAQERTKKLPERLRRRRKPLPVPSVPIFVMVSPGRYVRTQDATPCAATTPQAADDPLPAPEATTDAPVPTQTEDASAVVGEGFIDTYLEG